MFKELFNPDLDKIYNENHSNILLNIDKQLSNDGVILQLDKLPTQPIKFKEIFIRWIIAINKTSKFDNIITKSLILRCPIWNLIPCPLVAINLTQESLFNKSIGTNKSKGNIGTKSTIKSFNSKRK